MISAGGGPQAQVVAYGTADGRVRLRRLASGEPVGEVMVADAVVTDRARALRSAFGSSGGVLFVVHDDGGGVEVARIDEATGRRLGPDVAVAGSLGCAEVGAPLLTPVAKDGSRLLFFTMTGSCSAGPGLVRYGVSPSGELIAAGVAPVAGLGFAAPAFAYTGEYSVAVARTGGVELRNALGDLGAPPDSVIPLPAGETPVAVAGDGYHRLYVLTASGDDGRLFRIALDGFAVTDAPIAGSPLGLAVAGDRVVAATRSGLTVLTDALAPVGTVPGAASAPSIAGRYAYSGSRAVALDDASTRPLPFGEPVAPAIARGFVSYGARTLITRDVTPPSVVLAGEAVAALAGDDRGVARVSLRIGPRKVPTSPVVAPFDYVTYEGRRGPIPPGDWRVRAVAVDRAGNVARDAGARIVVPCGRRARGGPGADVLRGGSGRDCLDGLRGPDRLLATGGGADTLRCGPGRDVAIADRIDHVADDCERARRHRP